MPLVACLPQPGFRFLRLIDRNMPKCSSVTSCCFGNNGIHKGRIAAKWKRRQESQQGRNAGQ